MSSDRSTPRRVGRYVLYSEIASGGMATVYLGRLAGPIGFGRTVAIKRLHPHLATDPEFVSMFLDEARVAARIHHPNVVSTLDVAVEGKELFLVMEYVEGASLAHLLREARSRKEPVDPAIASSIVSSVAYGLHAAHETRDERGASLEVVHRDVSPQNILVSPAGVSQIVDFGVARAVGRVQTTREGQLKGKIRYMAPEQLRRQKADRRVDVYAATVVLWETLTGRRLVDGESEADVVAQLLAQDPLPPSHYRSDLPKALDEVVLRGLARKLSDRFQTAQELAESLESTVAPALPRDVGRWVRHLAGETLKQREQQKAALVNAEASSSVGDIAPVTPSTPDDNTAPPLAPQKFETDASDSRFTVSSSADERASRRKSWLLVPALAVLAASLVTWAAWPRTARLSSSAAALGALRRAARDFPTPPPSAEPSATPEPSGSAAPDVPPPKPSPGPGRARRLRLEPKKKNCNPPWVVDADGVKTYKRECL
jgi:eukaryotic-like serine/threonine-protein kinase